MPRRLAVRERQGGADRGARHDPFYLMFCSIVHGVARMILSIIVKLPYSPHLVLVYAQIPIGAVRPIPSGIGSPSERRYRPACIDAPVGMRSRIGRLSAMPNPSSNKVKPRIIVLAPCATA